MGEALVSFLDAQGRPTPVERGFVLPPASRIGPLTEAERVQILSTSALAGKYEAAIDRESAYERLRQRAGAGPTAATQSTQSAQSTQSTQAESWSERLFDRGNGGASAGTSAGASLGSGASVAASVATSLIGAVARSAVRTIGSQIGREIVRGVLGGILGGNLGGGGRRRR